MVVHASMLLAATGCLGLGFFSPGRYRVLRAAGDALMLAAMVDAGPFGAGVFAPLAWAALLVGGAMSTAFVTRRRAMVMDVIPPIGMILAAALLLVSPGAIVSPGHPEMGHGGILLTGLLAGVVVFVIAACGAARSSGSAFASAHTLAAAGSVALMAVAASGLTS